MAMEDGGDSLFDFVSKAHRLIMAGSIKPAEWIRVVKVIMNQLVEAVEFMLSTHILSVSLPPTHSLVVHPHSTRHNLNICHFDLSLENILVK